MKTKPGSLRIGAQIKLKWDCMNPEERQLAHDRIEFLRARGFILTDSSTNIVKFNKKFTKHNSVAFMHDIFEAVLGVRELSSIMDMLRHLGLSPSIYTRGTGKNAVFRFHVDAGKNFWEDHKVADEAAARAVEAWAKAGRPLD